jgi:hypothetical protein
VKRYRKGLRAKERESEELQKENQKRERRGRTSYIYRGLLPAVNQGEEVR